MNASQWQVINEGHRIGVTDGNRIWWLAQGSLTDCHAMANYLNNAASKLRIAKRGLWRVRHTITHEGLFLPTLASDKLTEVVDSVLREIEAANDDLA